MSPNAINLSSFINFGLQVQLIGVTSCIREMYRYCLVLLTSFLLFLFFPDAQVAPVDRFTHRNSFDAVWYKVVPTEGKTSNLWVIPPYPQMDFLWTFPEFKKPVITSAITDTQKWPLTSNWKSGLANRLVILLPAPQRPISHFRFLSNFHQR
jgi:hypothetical protein